jgi:hypothetical protein
MAKIMKRTVDALEAHADHDVLAWDTELTGFGVRVKPSGVKTFLVQYQKRRGPTRRLVFGRCGALTPKVASDLARKRLTEVAEGEDPSAGPSGFYFHASVQTRNSAMTMARKIMSWTVPAWSMDALSSRTWRQTISSQAPPDR